MGDPAIGVEWTADVGIPSEIKLIVPKMPDMKLVHNLPTHIDLRLPPMAEIRVAPIHIPSEIAFKGPSQIELVAVGIPSTIGLDASGVPSSILVEPSANFPSSIKLDASSLPSMIQVVGVPSTIELVGAPSEIKLIMPENPVVEMKYSGAPVDVRISLDVDKLTGAGGDDGMPCFALVPCPRK